jgi:hypothetical protein
MIEDVLLISLGVASVSNVECRMIVGDGEFRSFRIVLYFTILFIGLENLSGYCMEAGIQELLVELCH